MSAALALNHQAEVKIDRLVLDIPGLDPAQAKRLALEIGEGLAGSGLTADHANIGIALGPLTDSRTDLAARIVAALMERLI
jgi:hypothetical protein